MSEALGEGEEGEEGESGEGAWADVGMCVRACVCVCVRGWGQGYSNSNIGYSKDIKRGALPTK
jgi:hypothetical protein